MESKLQEVFKYLKPTLLMCELDGKHIEVRQLGLIVRTKYAHYNFFHQTKKFTGLKKKEADKLWEHYVAIRALRNRNKTIGTRIVCEANPNRFMTDWEDQILDIGI
jgi:hypothetical protein